MTSAFELFVRTDAVKVASAAAKMRIDTPRDRGQQGFQCGVRIDAWIDRDLVANLHGYVAFREPEWEPGREVERVIPIRAATREVEIDRRFETRSGRNAGEVECRRESAFRASVKSNRKGRDDRLVVLDDDAPRDVAARRDMFGMQEFEFESGQRKTADETGDDQRGEHRGENQKQEVVGGSKCSESDDHRGRRKYIPGARDALAESGGNGIADALANRAHKIVGSAMHRNRAIYRAYSVMLDGS